MGQVGDIALSGTDIPENVARIYAVRTQGGRVETRIDLLNAEDGTVEETVTLHSGDEIPLAGQYRLRYLDTLEDLWHDEGENDDD